MNEPQNSDVTNGYERKIKRYRQPALHHRADDGLDGPALPRLPPSALAPCAALYRNGDGAAILHGDRERLLGFDASEHPVAVQLGGSEPADLAEAAAIAADFGYDEINLNIGCPSERVQSGAFGACLMREPELVADCVAAMKARVWTCR